MQPTFILAIYLTTKDGMVWWMLRQKIALADCHCNCDCGKCALHFVRQDIRPLAPIQVLGSIHIHRSKMLDAIHDLWEHLKSMIFVSNVFNDDNDDESRMHRTGLR